MNYKKKYLKYKLKYVTLKKNMLSGGDTDTQSSIGIASYNISFATQKNENIGSEKDFVEECQEKHKKGGITCHNNAIESIKKAINAHGIKLIGFQEVAHEVSAKNLENQISLDKNWFAEYHTCHTPNFRDITTVLMSMWDPNIFGEKKKITNI